MGIQHVRSPRMRKTEGFPNGQRISYITNYIGKVGDIWNLTDF
jgi:hypothetical protein